MQNNIVSKMQSLHLNMERLDYKACVFEMRVRRHRGVMKGVISGIRIFLNNVFHLPRKSTLSRDKIYIFCNRTQHSQMIL